VDEQQLVRVAKALSDATRFRILKAIALNGDISCGKLAEHFHVTHATVSHHLKILSDSGLINLRRKGQFSYAQAIAGALSDYYNALDLAFGRHSKKDATVAGGERDY
jgi:ArsR family transcriptional regulator